MEALLPENKYAVEPAAGDGLGKYIASLPERRIREGQAAYDNFVDVLKKMSDVVVDMVENDFLLQTKELT